MSRKRLQLYGQNRSIEVETDATIGAIIGVDVFNEDGTLFVPQAPAAPGDMITYWRLVQEIPLNVVALEEAAGTGLFAVTAEGVGAFREIVSETLTITFGDGVAGDPEVELALLPDSGVGAALVKQTRDAYGRVEGTEAATTDDLAEGTANLYFTDERADARIAVAKADPDGIASLAGGKLDPGQLPALAITETFVVASQAAMLALTAQQGDVAVRSDQQKSYILTADPATTLANWQELLVPTGVGVASFNGRTGSVVPATGDYTPAQVGAEPSFATGTTSQYRRGDKSWRDFATDVRAAVLTGLSTATNAAISATDSVLQALGKLQAQATDLAASKLNSSSVSAFMLTVLDDATDSLARDTLQAMPLKLVVAGRNADFTYAAADANVATGKTTGTPRTYTVDASLLTVGAYYYAANYSSVGDVTVAAAVGTTMRLTGTATTGNRTVGPFGLGRIWIRSANEVWVDGPGVT